MYKIKKTAVCRLLYIAYAIILLVSITACNKKEQETDNNSSIKIYYLNNSRTGLVSVNYNEDFNSGKYTVEQAVEIILKKMSENHKKDISPISENVKIIKTSVTAGNLVLSFDSTYVTQDTTDELLTRAAFVLSMTQIPGVDYVSFYVNDQPLTDKAGNVIGSMQGSSFTDINGDVINDYNITTFNFYYANKEGNALKKYTFDHAYKNNVSLESFIIDTLISGKVPEDYYVTLSDKIKVNGILTKDNICYVDFSEDFLNNKSTVSDEIVIYSIVNSLSELSYISKVQISVNGNSDLKYGSIRLSQTFSRNLTLVE